VKRTLASLLNLAVVLLVGAFVGWAGSQGGATLGEIPVFGLCAALAFGINWLAFVPAYLAQTEHYYDLTGTLTYLTLLVVGLSLGAAGDARAWIIALLVAVWAVRLGSFLFQRIQRDGRDTRFDRIKPRFGAFLVAWSLQGLWVLLTLSCGLVAMTTANSVPLGPLAFLGIGVWLLGFGIEVVADRQKQAFRADPDNHDRFITTGLWSWSRHPNYFGEIMLWVGIALLALPTLAGWQYVTLVSPVFVLLLLTRISGVPMLESAARRRWGDDADYQAYLARTPVLVPRPPARLAD
jgi:steroid 5-alpha reductase family enzyme